jgi:hypothetical protein
MRLNALHPLAIVAVFLACAGCGLPDYERRIDAHRARLAAFDEANKLLENPLETPKKGEGNKDDPPAWHADIFLRLPKGYGTTPKEKQPYNDPFPCFRYSNGEAHFSIFVAVNVAPDPKAKEEIGKYHAKNFSFFAKQAILDYYYKNTKIPITERKPETRKVAELSPYPDTAGKITYQYFQTQLQKKGSEPSVFGIYLHEDAGKQVAILVERPLKLEKADEFNKSLEASLGSLDISSEAASKRAAFKKPAAP